MHSHNHRCDNLRDRGENVVMWLGARSSNLAREAFVGTSRPDLVPHSGSWRTEALPELTATASLERSTDRTASVA
jgi:hypothetical protein